MALIARRSARLAEWRAQHRLRLGFERAGQKRFQAELNRVAREASRLYRSDGQVGVAVALSAHPDRLRAILERHDRAVMNTFGERVLDSIKAFGGFETKDAESTFARLRDAWIRDNALAKANLVSETTRARVLAAILAGEEAGEGIPAIAKRISETTGGAIGRFRATTIARTETHSASQAADQQATEALDLPDDLKNEWIAAEDSRTRDSHAVADGQVRAQGEAFNVGASLLKHPGDPTAPPAEIVRCRCVLALTAPEDF